MRSATQQTEFSIWPLLADVACLSAAVIVVGVLLFWHYRRRGSWLRFSLRELFALTTVVALAAGWWMYHRAAWKRESALMAELAEHHIGSHARCYGGPQWIRRLVGDEDLEMFCHPDSINVSADPTRESWSLLERSVSRLPYARRLSVQWRSPDWAVDWTKFSHFEEICLIRSEVNGGTLNGLDAIPALKVLELKYCSLNNDGLAHLANCTALEELDLCGTFVNDAGMVRLRRLKHLRKLDLSLTALSDAGVAQLAPLTELRELSLAGTKATDACLPVLQKLPHLEVLDLRFLLLTDSGARRLLDFPSLKSISLPNHSAISDETLGLLRQRIETVYLDEPRR